MGIGINCPCFTGDDQARLWIERPVICKRFDQTILSLVWCDATNEEQIGFPILQTRHQPLVRLDIPVFWVNNDWQHTGCLKAAGDKFSGVVSRDACGEGKLTCQALEIEASCLQ